MLDRLTGDIGDMARQATRRIGLMIIAVASFLAMTGFAAAAIVIFIIDRFGLLYAILAGGGFYLAIAMLAALVYMLTGRRRRRAEAPASARRSAAPAGLNLTDPMVLMSALQVARTIGLKRVIPILAIAGLAAGYFLSRGLGSDEPSDDEPTEN